MRYSPLLLVLPLSLSLPILTASAAESPDLLSQRYRATQDFWPHAQRLVQQQLDLINRIQQAIASPDLYRVEAVRGQLILQTGAVERFLKSQYATPTLLCSNGTSSPDVPADLSLPQREVYCALYASTQQLKPVVSLLERRLPMLAGLAAPNTLPSPNEPLSSSPLNFRNPVKPRFATGADLPVSEPPVIGRLAKTPVSEYQQPFQPAILPPQQATTALSAARERLLSTRSAFGASVRIIDPAQTPEIVDRSTYDLSPLELQQYAKFLAQPNTGIARVLLVESYRPDPNQLRNRLQPTVAERFPFVALGQSTSGLIARFAMQIEDGNFQVPFSGLDYGFMVNLGEVPLENLNATLKNVSSISPEQREFFLNYSPPNQLEALQIDRRRLLIGKDGEALVAPPGLRPASSDAPLSGAALLTLSFPSTRDDGSQAAFPAVRLPASTQAPLVPNNTYLVRLFQFQLPEVILRGESISRAQRRYLDQILETPSSDVLVAFQPVKQRFDGSYTVIWRLLNQFPDPKITDLEDYVYLE